MDRNLDLEMQYDRIYRYCYFKLHSRETAEDITQETFLRFLESRSYRNYDKPLQYLYTIARNLCIDEYRRKERQNLPLESMEEGREREGEGISGMDALEYRKECDMEERLVTTLMVREALAELDEETQEILLLRYANEVPVNIIGKMLGISRFAVFRKTKTALAVLRQKLGKEGFHVG